jgi:hypothetical protein
MPDAPLSFPEKAALLALMTFVDKVPNPDIRARYGFSISGEVRTHLENDGYIAGDRDPSRPGRPYVFHLEERGWRWCRDELSTPPSRKIPRAYRLLYGVLNSIDDYLRRSQCRTEDFFVVDGTARKMDDPATSASESHMADAAAVEKRIRSAYHELVSEPRGWVGLRSLRDRLDDLPRADVDAVLRRLDLLSGVYLQPESDQKVLTAADREAAIRIGGEPKHLLSIEGA